LARGGVRGGRQDSISEWSFRVMRLPSMFSIGKTVRDAIGIIAMQTFLEIYGEVLRATDQFRGTLTIALAPHLSGLLP
jgi:hypothetical protein